MELVKKILRGDEGSAARLISMIEEDLMKDIKQFPFFSLIQARHALLVYGCPLGRKKHDR